jgi:hypothetical protein
VLSKNVNGFSRPKCGGVTHILSSGAGERIARDMGMRFLEAISLDPKIAESCDSDRAFVHHVSASPMAEVMLSGNWDALFHAKSI